MTSGKQEEEGKGGGINELFALGAISMYIQTSTCPAPHRPASVGAIAIG